MYAYGNAIMQERWFRNRYKIKEMSMENVEYGRLAKNKVTENRQGTTI